MSDAGWMRIDRDAMLAGVQWVAQVIDARGDIPILTHMALRATGDAIELMGSDIDRQMRMHATGAGAGGFTAPAAKLLAAVETLRSGMIDILFGDGRVTMKQGRSTRSLPTLPLADFPLRPAIAADRSFAVATNDLHRMLSAALVATHDMATSILSGVCMADEADALVAVATDANRLALATCSLPEGAAGMGRVIIGRPLVQLILRVLARTDERMAMIAIGPRRIAMTLGETDVGGALMEGTFPDYRRVIPAEHARRMAVQAAEIGNAVRVGNGVIDAAGDGKRKERGLRLTIDAEGAMMSAGDGRATIEEPIEATLEGEPLAIVFNGMMVGPLLGLFGDSEALEICFGDKRTPMLIRAPGRDDLLTLAMPMRS